MVPTHRLEQVVVELYVGRSGTLLVVEARKSVSSKLSLYATIWQMSGSFLIYMRNVHAVLEECLAPVMWQFLTRKQILRTCGNLGF